MIIEDVRLTRSVTDQELEEWQQELDSSVVYRADGSPVEVMLDNCCRAAECSEY